MRDFRDNLNKQSDTIDPHDHLVRPVAQMAKVEAVIAGTIDSDRLSHHGK
jgi:hypothetical protein